MSVATVFPLAWTAVPGLLSRGRTPAGGSVPAVAGTACHRSALERAHVAFQSEPVVGPGDVPSQAVGSNSGDNDDDAPVAVALVVHGVLVLGLGFCEHFGGDGFKILARAYYVPDTGWCYQAFASDSCRENWRVPSLDPGLAA